MDVRHYAAMAASSATTGTLVGRFLDSQLAGVLVNAFVAIVIALGHYLVKRINRSSDALDAPRAAPAAAALPANDSKVKGDTR